MKDKSTHLPSSIVQISDQVPVQSWQKPKVIMQLRSTQGFLSYLRKQRMLGPLSLFCSLSPPPIAENRDKSKATVLPSFFPFTADTIGGRLKDNTEGDAIWGRVQNNIIQKARAWGTSRSCLSGAWHHTRSRKQLLRLSLSRREVRIKKRNAMWWSGVHKLLMLLPPNLLLEVSLQKASGAENTYIQGGKNITAKKQHQLGLPFWASPLRKGCGILYCGRNCWSRWGRLIV